MLVKKINTISKTLLIYVLILFILLLTSVNIDNFLKPKKVLGVTATTNNDEGFWKDFLAKNPNYIPGWIEIGQPDRARSIDPNYFVSTP